ncbi:MAG: 2-oxoglutarate ferredoxin oxidoreductase subunit alpha [Bacillales bacterium]|jgi:2-oxoglutarate ferredoxin oxidoreductase subunit alpha|nr:2-oxoglutarate ferredoxin oxidoreductase subunit alpha [Bacillales bacterium]
MLKQLSWKVGGQQGEGIESTGEIFCIALNRLGYFLYGYRHFSSRIKGGHTNNKIRVSTSEIRSISKNLDILVAFDQETIDLNSHELQSNGMILADAKFNPVLPENCEATLLVVPFTQIATELGTSLMKNMVAIGASAALMNLDKSIFSEVVKELFERKGESVVQKNIEAVESGLNFVNELLHKKNFGLQLEKADGKKRLFMIGNDAIAMGCMAGGARFMAAYPITPATEIMEYLIKRLPEVGGTVIQTEDEISACAMAIGANYGGVRSLTSSSGPGLSLMMESIGLAGMTETPLVIVNVQRGGPSTGLPTKQEQSDLMAMIYGTHGEIPKIVLAPSTAEEAFYDAAEAFNLAEEYQCPVILLTDLQLSLGKQTIEILDLNKVLIRRGKLVDQPIPEREGKALFKRYEENEDGISPRVIPGMKNGIHHVTGVEHDQTGRPSESTKNRITQMNKRMRKLNSLKMPNAVHIHTPHEKADILFVGFNSTRGAIEEAMEKLNREGVKVNHAHIRLVHPFPSESITPLIESAKKVIVVENNATAQLANIIKMNVGHTNKIVSMLRYDGNPFLPEEVYSKSKEMM